MHDTPTDQPTTAGHGPSRVLLEQLWWHNDHHPGNALRCTNPNCHAAATLIAWAVAGTEQP